MSDYYKQKLFDVLRGQKRDFSEFILLAKCCDRETLVRLLNTCIGEYFYLKDQNPNKVFDKHEKFDLLVKKELQKRKAI